MSVNGFVFNLINDLKVTVNLGKRRQRGRPSAGQMVRGLVALGLSLCLLLMVTGLTIAGATSGIENPHPLVKTVYVGFLGAGLIPGVLLFFVYNAMSGGER